jgi:osmotically-inducible protein OsmY
MRSAKVRYARAAVALSLLSALVALQGCAALFVAGGAAAVMSATDRRTVGAQLDDENIEVKAAAAIRSDPALKSAHVNVSSFNAIVLLTGEAPTAEQRDKVLAAVRDIAGVRRTVNEIRIAPVTELSSRSHDSWLTTKVRSKLIAVEDLDSAHVKIVTENAVIYLMGLVRQKEAELATNAATEVGGVARVVKLFEYLD